MYSIDVPPGAGTVNIQAYDAGLYSRGGNEQLETGDRTYSTREPRRRGPCSARTRRCWNPSDATAPGGCPPVVIDEGANVATYKNLWATLLHGDRPGRARALLAQGGDEWTW